MNKRVGIYTYFIFSPYRKDAKFSVNLERLSFMMLRFIMFPSRSERESESSAKDGSKASMGTFPPPRKLALPDSRRDDREEGRRGVVGRDIGLRLPEVDLFELRP